MSQKEDIVIEGIGRGQPPRAVSARPDSVPTAAETARTGGSDAVSGVTSGRQQPVSGLSGIAADLAAKPPVDAAKVERLRAGIISGDYRVDPDAIAAAMIALESPPPKD